MTAAVGTFLSRAVAASQDRSSQRAADELVRNERYQARLRERFAEQLSRLIDETVAPDDIHVSFGVGVKHGMVFAAAEIDSQRFEWRPLDIGDAGHELRHFYHCPACGETSFHGAAVTTLADIGDVVQGHWCLNPEVA